MNRETLDWRVSAMETLTMLKCGSDVSSDHIEDLVNIGKMQIGSDEYMLGDSVLMNRLSAYISCLPPEISEWRKIRSWIRKNWKLPTGRFMTSVSDEGWCGIEAYSDGDCILFGGQVPEDSKTPLAIHGLDVWFLTNQDVFLNEIRPSISERKMPDATRAVIGAAIYPWILSMVADNWWRIRHLMKAEINRQGNKDHNEGN